MSRLTHKFGNEYDIINDNRVRDFKKDYQYATNKLGQLEDIEEKLGIDLYHIMEAILNGYYWKDIEGNICHFPELDFIRKDTCDESPCRLNHYYWNHTGKYLEDYGRTWALTREELESKEKEMIKSGLLTDKPQF